MKKCNGMVGYGLIALLMTVSAADAGQPGAVPDPENDMALRNRIVYAGLAATDPDQHIFGASPIIDDDGKVHLFASRFGPDFMDWKNGSHIVHYVADKPDGPFKFVDVVTKGDKSKPGNWNYKCICNPCIQKVDGKYVLFFIGRTESSKQQMTGMMTAESPNGPWSKPVQILMPSDDPDNWTYQTGNLANPAFVKFKDKYYLYYKSTNARYGVAVADKLEGPYIHHPKPITNTTKTIEDGTAFVWKGKVFLVTTDNHGTIQRGCGLLWESDDGVKFGNPVLAYYNAGYHLQNAKTLQGTLPINKGRLPRPQILMVDGEPAWLYAPLWQTVTGHKYTQSHCFRILSEKEVLEKRSKKTGDQKTEEKKTEEEKSE